MYSYQPSPAQLISFSEQEIMERSIKEDHPFRKLDKLINLDKIARHYRFLYSKTGTPGIPVEKAVRMLVVQFYEDYSDRQMERALEENLAVKGLSMNVLLDRKFKSFKRKLLKATRLKVR